MASQKSIRRNVTSLPQKMKITSTYTQMGEEIVELLPCKGEVV